MLLTSSAFTVVARVSALAGAYEFRGSATPGANSAPVLILRPGPYCFHRPKSYYYFFCLSSFIYPVYIHGLVLMLVFTTESSLFYKYIMVLRPWSLLNVYR